MRVKAQYKPVKFCSAYAGNPLIEALPAIHSPSEALQLLLARPDINMQEMRSTPAHERIHSLSWLDSLFIPRSEMSPLESEIGMLIRSGYAKRNPILPNTTRQIYTARERMRLQGGVESPLPPCLALTGLSGLGKSRSIKSVLSLYPQVIQHRMYEGKRFNHQQITWISLDAPVNGSVTGFLLRAFGAIDRALGLEGPACYVNQYGRAKISVDTKIEELGQIASTFHLGLLHIDDLQRLAEVGTKQSRPVINLIIQLANVVKVPLLLSGTYQMVNLIAGSMEASRRVSSEGIQHLKPPCSAQDGHFQLLVAALEKYQFVDRPVSFDAAWKDKLFELSQGLPAVLLSIVKNAQKIALRTGQELSLGHLETAYQEHCTLLHPALEALRKKQGDCYLAYEDLLPPPKLLELANEKLRKQARKAIGAP